MVERGIDEFEGIIVGAVFRRTIGTVCELDSSVGALGSEGGAPEADYVECDHGCETFDDYHVDVDGYFDDANGVGAEEEYNGDEELCEKEEKWGGGDVEHPFITIVQAKQQSQVS